METFGELLGTYRDRLGMSQRTLARRIDLSPSQLSRIESGQRRPPPAETVLRMIEVLRLGEDGAAKLLEAAGYSPELFQSVTAGGTLSSEALQDLVQSLEHAAADLESASQQLRSVIAVLTSIRPPRVSDSQESE